MSIGGTMEFFYALFLFSASSFFVKVGKFVQRIVKIRFVPLF